MTNSCIVWSPIDSAEESNLEMPTLIANAIDGPIFTHDCPASLSKWGHKGVEFTDFDGKTVVDEILAKTPLHQLNTLFQYATWKPPAEYDSFITRGPKSIHTTQRIGQRHIHYFEGSYRAPFIHKNLYDEFDELSALSKTIRRPIRHYLRTAIQGSVNTIDTVVVNSEWTGDVIRSLYDREPDEVIYPLMSTDAYTPENRTSHREDFYLYLGGLDTHHRVKEVVRAFNDLPYTLKVAGTGPQMNELKRISDSSIHFEGYVEGNKKEELLANAKALVNPTDHSFGRVLIESLASGTPVISVRAGFAPYLLDEGSTGLLYDEGVDNMVDTVETYERDGVSATTDELVAATAPFERAKNATKWQRIASGNSSKVTTISEYE